MTSIEQLVEFVQDLGDVVVQRPAAGDDSPEISWGDLFFYYSPSGLIPRGQPFATIVTKRYPDEGPSALDRPGAFRVNVPASGEDRARLAAADTADGQSESDRLLPHPVYGDYGWLAVIDPGPSTEVDLRALLVAAHARARRSVLRRQETGSSAPDA